MSTPTSPSPASPGPATPGWYPAELGFQRYWDGTAWSAPAPVAPTFGGMPPAPQIVVVQGGAGGKAGAVHVSGLTTGGHLFHAMLTIFTCGLRAPVCLAKAFLGRRRIG